MRARWTTERTPPPGPSDPGFARATVAAAVVVVVAGTLGTLWLRGWGRVGFEVPSAPWYFSFPFYVFPGPRLDPGWAAAALPVAAAVAATVALYRARTGAWPRRVAASAGLAAVLALAVAALAGGPAAWGAPFDYAGEYPAGAGRVGAIPTFLREFPARLPDLPSHATGHPAGAMVAYGLVDRVWPGLTAAALATVAVGSLGAVAAGGWPATSWESGAAAWPLPSGWWPPGSSCTWRLGRRGVRQDAHGTRGCRPWADRSTIAALTKW
jgi:hypothetical protein